MSSSERRALCFGQYNFLLLLWIFTAHSLDIEVRRIPSQPVQLKSGGSVVLLCTVTTNTLPAVQWYNGTILLEGMSDSSVLITDPYRLNNGTWQSAMEVVVLTVYSSGWYYCKPDELAGYGSIQLNVQDASKDSSLSLSYPTLSLYATVPFALSCTSEQPADSQLQTKITWYRNDVEILTSDSSFSTQTHYINSTTVESSLTATEPLAEPGVVYRCSMIASTLSITIYTISKHTPTFKINVPPTLNIHIDSSPSDGPLLDTSFTLSCVASPSVNGSVSLQWKDSKDLPVKSSSNLLVGETQSGLNGSHASLVFTRVREDDEDTFTCYGSLTLHEYPYHIVSESTSYTITSPAAVTSVRISALPSGIVDWIEGSDAALICTVETSRTASDLSLEWSNSQGGIYKGVTITSLTDTAHQSVLELYSLSVHDDVYYCRASIGGSGVKQDWHYVNVISNLSSTSSVALLHSSSSAPTVGESYEVYCISTKPTNVVSLPIVTWTRSSGAVIMSDESHDITSLTDNGTHVVSGLVFQSLQYSDAGGYACQVLYSVFGSTETVKGSASSVLEVQVATPLISIGINTRGLECLVQLSTLSNADRHSVDTVWYLIDELGNSIQANSAPEVTLSTLSTENCNTYFRQYLYFETLQGVQERYETVSCEAIVSVDVDDVIESISRRTAFLKSFADITPAKPDSVNIRNYGSQWAEVSWSSTDNSMDESNFQIEYHRSRDNMTLVSSDKIYRSSEKNVYTGVVTDLDPATEYTVRIAAGNGAKIIRSNAKIFTTNETVPSGNPLNFTYSFALDGSVELSWSPPELSKRNGEIIDYSVSCQPSLMMRNNKTRKSCCSVSLYGVALGTRYHCSVAAVNSKGAGPQSTLQFAVSLGDGSGGVSDNASGFQWNAIVYYIVPMVVVGIVAVVIIVSLAVAVWYYKKKFGKYVLRKGPPLASPVSSTPNPPTDTDRYVSSNAINDMLQRNERRPRYIELDRQSSSVPLQLELKSQESEV